MSTIKNNMKTGIELIAEERQRQIEVEGYSKEHDSQHKASEFIEAANSYTESAVAYALKDEGATNDALTNLLPYLKKSFVWGYDAFKPTNCLRDLIKAGALIAAAIDRLQMTEIKAGNYYMCLKDIEGYDSFTKGKVYASLYDNALINDNHIEVKVKNGECFRIATENEIRTQKGGRE